MSVSVNLYSTDMEDLDNVDWFSLKQNFPEGENSYGPAYGSTIRIAREFTEVGEYGNRKIHSPIAVHTLLNSFIGETNFSKISRWYQEDGNTQIFRLFPGEDSIRNERRNAPRTEAFGLAKWQRGDGWYEWSGRYTFLKVRPGAVLQIKHNITYWSLQLILEENENGRHDLYYVKLRNPSGKVLLMQDVEGQAVDIKVLDNGEDHKVYVNAELKVERTMDDRPREDKNHARWGLYSPTSAMDREILILVTGAYVGPEGGYTDEVSVNKKETVTPSPKTEEKDVAKKRNGDADTSVSKMEQTGFLSKWPIKNSGIDQASEKYQPADNFTPLPSTRSEDTTENEIDYQYYDPDPTFLKKYYSDHLNMKNGFF
jgi:hypothetical protein